MEDSSNDVLPPTPPSFVVRGRRDGQRHHRFPFALRRLGFNANDTMAPPHNDRSLPGEVAVVVGEGGHVVGG